MVIRLDKLFALCLLLTSVSWGVIEGQSKVASIDDRFDVSMSLENYLNTLPDPTATFSPEDFIENNFDQFYETEQPDLRG